jgi:hypothetical protein
MATRSGRRAEGASQVRRRIVFGAARGDGEAKYLAAGLGSRRAVSIAPRFSTFLSGSSNSGASISAIGREPICGKTSPSSRARINAQYLGASLLRWLAIHSRAIASNVF